VKCKRPSKIGGGCAHKLSAAAAAGAGL